MTIGEVDADIRNTAMMLRTEVARPEGTRDWFTIEDVAEHLPRDVDEPVVAETLEAMADRGLLLAYGGRNSVRRFFAPETLRQPGTAGRASEVRSAVAELDRRSR